MMVALQKTNKIAINLLRGSLALRLSLGQEKRMVC
jgi:hypothetical protein